MKELLDKQQSNWLNQLLNSSHIGILIVDKNRNNLMVNNQLSRMFGYSKGELIGVSAEILHTSHDSYKNFAKLAFDFVLKGKPLSIDYQFKKKDGTLLWVHISGDNVQGEDEVLWIMIDVTQSKAVQDEVFTLKERLELAVHGNKDIIWDWNVKTGGFFVTQRWKELIGHDKKEVPYTIKEWRKYIHPDDLRDVLRATTACIRGESKYLDTSYRLKHSDGHWIWINMRGLAQYDKDSDCIRITGTQRDISIEKNLQNKIIQQQEILQYQANYDALTSLPNRLLFHDRLEQAIKKAKRHKTKIALFFIDLDHFKEINDTMGHKVGDEVLRVVSHHLLDRVRKEDTVARLGGDEFTIILEDLKSKSIIDSLAKDIVNAVAKPIEYHDELLEISCSIGISIYPDDSTDSDSLLSYADSAMYDAKAKGKNNFQFYSVK